MEQSVRSRLQAGHASAFAELFDTHADAIYRYAVRVCGDWAVAEEVVSLTFLEAWRGRATLHDGDDPVRPWLFGIAANVLRNNARGARRRRAALLRLPSTAAQPDFADALVDQLDDTNRLATTRRAMAELRRKDREVIELCVWGGLDYAAAATALGIPVGTVRSRLSRARTRLRALVDPVEPEPLGGQIQHNQPPSLQAGQRGSR